MKNKKILKLDPTGFTLIEVLVVVGILIILASIMIPSVRPFLSRGKKAKARADIARLEIAVQAYSSDFGEYPADMNIASLTRLLTDINLYIANTRWQGPYLELKKEEVSAGQFVDPWGNGYRYENAADGDYFAGGPYNKGFVEIYSFGPDQGDDGGLNNDGALDDINNWQVN